MKIFGNICSIICTVPIVYFIINPYASISYMEQSSDSWSYKVIVKYNHKYNERNMPKNVKYIYCKANGMLIGTRDYELWVRIV